MAGASESDNWVHAAPIMFVGGAASTGSLLATGVYHGEPLLVAMSPIVCALYYLLVPPARALGAGIANLIEQAFKRHSG